MAAAARASLRLVADPARRAALGRLVAHAGTVLARHGVAATGSPIMPLIVGDDAATMRLADAVQAAGYDVRGIRPPTVPPGTARLRLSITLGIGADDIDGLAAALAAVRLVGLTNDVSLRNLIPGELAKGFGFFQSKPASSFSPVFVTPDALGDWWNDGKLHRTLNVDLNDKPFGRAEAGEDMTFDFGTLIAHAAKTRKLGAGTIVGSGTVSNRDHDGGPGKPIAAGGVGYSCLAEVRTVETINGGAPVTPFLKKGDTVRIWAEDERHHPIFGTIEQVVG